MQGHAMFLEQAMLMSTHVPASALKGPRVHASDQTHHFCMGAVCERSSCVHSWPSFTPPASAPSFFLHAALSPLCMPLSAAPLFNLHPDTRYCTRQASSCCTQSSPAQHRTICAACSHVQRAACACPADPLAARVCSVDPLAATCVLQIPWQHAYVL